MTRLASDVKPLARWGAFFAMAPAFAYGIAFISLVRSDAHWAWSLALGGLVGWAWTQTVGAFRDMYLQGRRDGSSTAWEEAVEACEADHYCRICGGPQ